MIEMWDRSMPIRTLIWNENEHEKTNALVQRLYPQGIHGAIKAAFAGAKDISASTATLDEPEHGLPVERLRNTDVLLWWGHNHMAKSQTRSSSGCSAGFGREWA
jgi:trehalose utilization protein